MSACVDFHRSVYKYTHLYIGYLQERARRGRAVRLAAEDGIFRLLALHDLDQASAGDGLRGHGGRGQGEVFGGRGVTVGGREATSLSLAVLSGRKPHEYGCSLSSRCKIESGKQRSESEREKISVPTQ